MIRWFTKNGVAANLLAGVTILVGLFVASSIKLELFPEIELDLVSVGVAYPGAAPEEVESGIIELIEDRIQDLEGVKKITAIAQESYGSLTVEVERGYSAKELRDKIEVRVDAITNFPEDSEEPSIEEIIPSSEVISLAIMGDSDPAELKRVAEFIRDELSIRESINQIYIGGLPPFEISINVSEDSLERYGLSFDQVVAAVSNASVDIPGGAIKSRGGEIMLRISERAYTRDEFEQIPVIRREDGSIITLGVLAEVSDGFVDEKLETIFNGKRAVLMTVYAVGDQNVLDLAKRVRKFSTSIHANLPEGITVEPFRDFSFYLEDRLNMLIENGVFGLILVLLILALFLRPSLAFFVMLGIPISFLGSLILLPPLGISINLASLFGFILVLGIVVDDAIIVGESVFTEFQRHGGPGVNASVAGTHRVAIPVTFAILTTVVAFIPILTMPGFLGKFFFPIPVVVIATLIWSLIESKLILPYHLTLCNVGAVDREKIGWLSRQQRRIADGLETFVRRYYQPTLGFALNNRYATVVIFVVLLAIAIALPSTKRIGFVFFPDVPSDYIIARLTMPEGTPVELTEAAIRQMREGLDVLIEETEALGLGQPFDNVITTIGDQPFDGTEGFGSDVNSHRAEIAVELVKRQELADGGDIEQLSSPYLAKRWRELIGPIAGVKRLAFDANAAGQGGAPIDIQLTGPDFSKLQEASTKIQAELATFEGLYDIRDNFSTAKREIQLSLKPAAFRLGITQRDIGNQVRSAFNGFEVQRIQRGRDDVKVMVRYPEAERRSVGNLETLRIRIPGGTSVPLGEVAEFEITDGFSAITRVNRRRVINIVAEADKGVADLDLIKEKLTGLTEGERGAQMMFDKEFPDKIGLVDQILGDYQGITWSLEGEAREQSDIFVNLVKMTGIVFFLIYALLAIPLKSYTQPIIVMIVIPFGLIGAIGGHVFMDLLVGQDLSILSILGFVALAGVVVNDSLVLVDYVNQERKSGTPLRQAIEKSGAARFRPIILTSLTTFAGLLPLLFETSLQAQFLIPMATSLSFGVLFATFMTLLLVPAFYAILEDLSDLARRILKLEAPEPGTKDGNTPSTNNPTG
ncbi:MAG: efflux RND transporter permease subunit [Verrucomicrobiota bacterium]